MIFTTWTFCAFMLLVFAGYWWVVPSSWRGAFLLIASMGYFTYNYPPYALLLGTLTVIVYAIGNLIWALQKRDAPKTQIKFTLGVGLLLCAGVLFFFKYSRMFALSYNSALRSLEIGQSMDVPSFLVPLGISFFTFEFIHYLVDLYLGKVPNKPSLLDFGLFAFFFPSLVSGPVKRFQLFQQQGREIGKFQAVYLADGLTRIVQGLAKKLIVADSADLLTGALSHPAQAGRVELWIAMYAYAVKIYYDFSGYTDIAIGCAQLLGYRLPENFNRPYRQANLQKFWNNWHMSLSSWIRDYLYIPLGGSRVSKGRAIFNLTLVMAICGLWHGANWNFVVWGLWNGLGLAGLQIYRMVVKPLPDSRPVRWFGTALTIQFVCFGWVFFAAPGLPEALIALRRMF